MRRRRIKQQKGPTTRVYRVSPGYEYAGETIEVTQTITEVQFRHVEAILSREPSRSKAWAERFVFEPFGPREAERLRSYLRDESIAHTTERLETWGPQRRAS